jgi:hypothetical protein
MPIASHYIGRDECSERFPPELLPLCDDALAVSCDLIEEYVARLALSVFQSLGIEEACRSEAGATIDQAVVSAGLGGRVIDVDIGLLGERGIQRHAQQSALSRRIDIQTHEGLGEQRSVLNDTQASPLLTDEDAPIGSEGHGDGIREPADEPRVLEARRERGFLLRLPERARGLLLRTPSE